MRGVVWLLAACSVPTEHPSVIDELTVLAMVSQPPEVGPGETLGLDVWVVDPSGRGADLLVWFCLPADSVSCAGAALGVDLTSWTWIGRGVDGLRQLRFEVPAEVASLLPPPPSTAPVLAWALACQPGQCDIHDQVEALPAHGSPAWGAVFDRLMDPTALLDGLSMQQANLAVRYLVLSNRPLEDRNLPPLLLPMDVAPLSVRAGDELVLSFQATDSLFVWPYTTAGQFEYSRYSAAPGATSMRWLAPPTPGPARLFVVADDGLGGTAVWGGEATVTP